MKQDKINQLIRILRETDKYSAANILAKFIGVSERTIRNYVNEINNDGYATIESSPRGYRLVKIQQMDSVKQAGVNDRIYVILSRVLAASGGISVFELSEQLMVSESTILNIDIPKLRREIRPFKLALETHDYVLSLIGDETSKRKLVGYLVTHNSYGFFTAQSVLNKLFPGVEIESVMKRLYEICDQSDLFINNFAMNNLLVHVIIILIRLQANAILRDGNVRTRNVQRLLEDTDESDAVMKLAQQISRYFEKEFNRQFPAQDYEQVVLLIILSVNRKPGELDEVMGHEFIDYVQQCLSELSSRYGIPEFDSGFTGQFALHMFNAHKRSEFGVSYPNPVTAKVKKEYAPVYDMAVFFAHRFAERYHLNMSEGEIGFIAFHLGSYIENNRKMQQSFTCVVVVESYLNFGKNIVQSINEHFDGNVVINEMMSLDEFLMVRPTSDVVISTIELPVSVVNLVIINPLPTQKDFTMINEMIERLSGERRLRSGREFLQHLFSPKLFFRNISCSSPEAYIRYMGEACKNVGLVSDPYIDDVVLREGVSSTAFTDALAVPHAITQFANSSFICVVHNDRPIKWTKGTVSFILLIGISKEQMHSFNESFDLLVDLFIEPERLKSLLATDSFAEFMKQLY